MLSVSRRSVDCLAVLLGTLLLTGSGAALAQSSRPRPHPSSLQDLPAIDQHLIHTLLVHQAGGLALADHAIPRLRDPRLRTLAEAIRGRQRRDQDVLIHWYAGWFGREAPSWTPTALVLPGFVLDPLAVETAGDGDRAFVEQVIPHLRLGLMIALQAQVHTAHRELLALEQRLVQRQSAEIRQLEAWSQQRTVP
ncbi:MAG: DUF305 domain-containing protein [Cyanobacteriota bacterium]